MKIFIGSSKEQSQVMDKVTVWLQQSGHRPVPWSGAIHPGKGTLIDQLIGISHDVDGAIFIFGEDDNVVGRLQPRDNVVFEYGLFMGALGPESVVFLRVGTANIASDLQGVVYIPWSGSAIDVQKEIEKWANGLAPAYVKGLGFDLAEQLVRILAHGVPVGHILGEVARELVDRNTSNHISALCSDKGEYSEVYYTMQFDWVAKRPERCIRRVFVRSRGDDYGFSPSEVLGIKMHLDQASNGVAIRWIFADSPWLGGPYSSSLGFAIFGESWIMHWGLESGASHDHTKGPDYGVLELLSTRFESLWAHAEDFEGSLKGKICERQEVAL